MKTKIVLMDETDREAFLRYCEAMERSEEDADRFLKAKRLARYQAVSPLTGEQIYNLRQSRIWAVVAAVFLIGFFVLCLKGRNL